MKNKYTRGGHLMKSGGIAVDCNNCGKKTISMRVYKDQNDSTHYRCGNCDDISEQITT